MWYLVEFVKKLPSDLYSSLETLIFAIFRKKLWNYEIWRHAKIYQNMDFQKSAGQ